MYINTKAVDIIKFYVLDRRISKSDLYNLCNNESTVHIIEKFLDENKEYYKNNGKNSFYFENIVLSNLCQNKNAVYIFEKILGVGKKHPYYNKIDWYILSGNKNAIHILEKNLDKIN